MVALLAIDSGSQSTKVSVVDEHGVVHAAGRAALRPYDLGPGGRVVHPDDDLWDALGAATRQALTAYDGAAGDVEAVGLCGIRFCRALLDADGRLVEPVLSWMDARVGQPVADVDPRVTTVTSAGGYLGTRLTGERRDSRATHQGVLPPDHLLPELVDPGALLGHVTTGAAAATGVPRGLPVFATANDKAVEALGCGLVAPGTVLLSLGTYVTAMTVAEPPGSPDDRYWVNDAAVPGRALVESRGVRRGMWTVAWLRELVGAAAPELVDPEAVERWLEDGARRLPPGAGGLLTLPDWLAPPDAPHRRGMVVGLDGSHGPFHLHRSVVEGIVMTMCDHVEAMESALGLAPGRLVVSGGGGRSDLVVQVVADVFGRPAARPAVADAAGLGAAVCAAVGHGVHPTFEAAVTAMTRPGDTCPPDRTAHAAYDELRPRLAELATATDPVLRRLHDRPG